jgi:cyclohexanone monooxygenase
LSRAPDHFDAVVVGAGLGGIHMLHELHRRGYSACGIEGGSDVGGAWYWNRYPGARCDVESFLYSYTFSPELDAAWTWSERYPRQPEIQRYIAFAADLWDVRRLIRFDKWVKAAGYDAEANRWTVDLSSGDRVSATFLIMATGPLTIVVWPDIPGIEDFGGERYHTARWSDGVTLEGKRIGVLGNGSSGTQFMATAARSAGALHALVRTPHYSVPAFNRPLGENDLAFWAANRDRIRADAHQWIVTGAGDSFTDRDWLLDIRTGAAYPPDEQRARLDLCWNNGGASLLRVFSDVMIDEDVNRLVADYVRARIASVIRNPAKAAIMMPRHFHFGAKRLVIDTGFYEIFNQDNVHPHDLRAHPIRRITKEGVETDEGLVELDMLVFATGFDAVTGSFSRMDIKGREGVTLNDYWAEGARSYLGLGVDRFPNMLMVNGPGAPGPFANGFIGNEWCVETVIALIDHMKAHGLATVEARPELEEQWMEQVAAMIAPTFFAQTENWYTGSNVAGKRRGIVNHSDPAGFRRALLDEQASGFAHLAFDRADAPLAS